MSLLRFGNAFFHAGVLIFYPFQGQENKGPAETGPISTDQKLVFVLRPVALGRVLMRMPKQRRLKKYIVWRHTHVNEVA